MRHALQALLVSAVAMLTILVAAGGACSRPCESSINCKRTCECLNTNTSTKSDCTLAFRCDSVEEACEKAYDNLSCDEICREHAGTGTCGFERCLTDADCQKRLTCPILDPQSGQPTGTFRDCTLPFRCDLDLQLCSVRSTATPEDLCRTECMQAVSVGG